MTTWKDLTPEQQAILERFVVRGDITDVDLLEKLGLVRYLHGWRLTDAGWNCLMNAPWMAEGKQAGPFAEAIAANLDRIAPTPADAAPDASATSARKYELLAALANGNALNLIQLAAEWELEWDEDYDDELTLIHALAKLALKSE